MDDKRDTDLHLYEIAKELGKWEEIAPYLGLDAVDIDDISCSGKSAALQRFVYRIAPNFGGLKFQ